MGSQWVGHDWATNTHTHNHMTSICKENMGMGPRAASLGSWSDSAPAYARPAHSHCYQRCGSLHLEAYCAAKKVGKRNIQEVVYSTPLENFQWERAILYTSLRRKKDTGVLSSGTPGAESRPLSGPSEFEETDAFWIPLEDTEEAARAIVGLTMEDDFHRQVDCFLRSRKIKPISATTQESVRAATSERTKRWVTKERKLHQGMYLLHLGGKLGFTVFA